MTKVDWRRQFTDPSYSIIKTETTTALDRMAVSRRPGIRKLSAILSKFIPADWGNWFA